jgi:hypothetical protein
MDAQEYLDFVAILEDTRTRIETVLSEPSFSASGAMAARLKRVAADLKRAVQTYRDKSNAHAPKRREATRSYAAHLTTSLTPRVALDLGMNLPPVCVEHAHSNGVRRPVHADHKRNRANGVMGVGGQIPQ